MLKKYFKSLILMLTYILSFDLLAIDLASMKESTEKDLFIVERRSIQRKIDDLSMKSLDFSSLPDENGMISTDIGFKVEDYCLERLHPRKLYNTLTKTVVEGLQCLLKLSEKNTRGKMQGSFKNALKLTRLVSSEEQISFVCSEPPSKFRKHSPANASSSIQYNNHLNPKIRHPYISINPNNNYIKEMQSNDLVIKGVFFHEIIHNIGHGHNADTIEYAYTCGECCFPRHNSAERQERACKICQGEYDDVLQIESLKDFLAYGNTLTKEDHAIFNLILKFSQRYYKINRDDF